MTLAGATTPSRVGTGNDVNKGVFPIPQSSNITGTSPSNCLMLYAGHLLMEGVTQSEVQSVCFTAPSDWLIYRCVDIGV